MNEQIQFEFDEIEHEYNKKGFTFTLFENKSLLKFLLANHKKQFSTSFLITLRDIIDEIIKNRS